MKNQTLTEVLAALTADGYKKVNEFITPDKDTVITEYNSGIVGCLAVWVVSFPKSEQVHLLQMVPCIEKLNLAECFKPITPAV